MKNKTIFRIGFICIIAFLIIASYLWYLYFKNYEGESLTTEFLPDLEILNSGKIDYVNAKVNDSDDIIPVYYFRIKNNTDNDISYQVLINDVAADVARDGCTSGTMFKREELKFELRLDNKIVASGVLGDLEKDLLYLDKIGSKKIVDYSMRVWLNDENVTDTNRHYHYVIDVKEL